MVDAGYSGPLGPFCRLRVEDSAPLGPGVCCRVIDERVMYAGVGRVLRQIAHGMQMGRPHSHAC
jgi:hypothetical protein